jgi:type I restriction enzyme S subunit
MSDHDKKEWNTRSLSELSTVKRGISYTASQLVDVQSGCPLYINMKSFRKDASYNRDGEKHFNGGYKKKNVLESNELLIVNTDVTQSGDILGVPVLIPKDYKNKTILYSHHVSCLSLTKDILKEFIFYQLSNDLIRKEIRNYGRGTTVKMLDSREFMELQVPIPASIKEQQKIASILSSVDEVIENTQTQIAKLEDLKKATMNELLAKGIGHTEFKDTEIGRIPKSWTGSPLEDMLIEVIDGDRGKEYPKDYDLSQKGYCLFLSAKNVTKKGFQFADLTYISREKDQKLRKGKAARNDIVITTRGTVGNIAIYDSLVPFNDIRINSGMALIRNKDNTISTEYLYHLLSSDLMARQIKRITFGSAQPQLTIKTIKELALPIPPTEEQDKISIIATTLTNQISALEKKHYSLANIKKALMQDLLTGKVRVQVN